MKTHWPEKFESGMFAFAGFVYILFYPFSLFSFFFAKHVIVRRLFRNIRLSLQYSSRSRTRLCMTCTSCTMPLPLSHSVQVLYSYFISNTLLLLLHRFRVPQATATLFRSLLLKSTSRSAHEIMYLSTTHVRLLYDVTDSVKMAALTAVFPLTDFPTSIF